MQLLLLLLLMLPLLLLMVLLAPRSGIAAVCVDPLVLLRLLLTGSAVEAAAL
jgi:hypothetical protein